MIEPQFGISLPTVMPEFVRRPIGVELANGVGPAMVYYSLVGGPAFRLDKRVIRRPIRVIHGENDKLVEQDQAKRLDIALPRSRLHTVHQAGHMVHYADLDGIMQAVDLEMETVGSRLSMAL